MQRLCTFILAVVISFIKVHAQISELGITPSFSQTYTLRSAGVKFFQGTYDSDTVVLYNPDLSVYMTVPIAPPVLPYTNESADYISEDLFDNDPSTIEYLVNYYYLDTALWESHTQVQIRRTDGTILFTADSVWLEWTSLFSAGRNYEPIFNTPEGARMVLKGVDQKRHVYALPGVLPCPNCDGSLNVGIGNEDRMIERTGSIDVFPNPSRTALTVTYELTPGSSYGQFVLLDPQGRVVERSRIGSRAGSFTVNTTHLAAGNYSSRIESDRGIISGPMVMVLH